ncbi:MAG: acetyl-CoA carboxylase biotin carboxylase subunit [Desulfurobacteriaceae bacterium]
MFKKVLVANRGEIAVRIIRTCKELGIKTVAVFSTADRDSLHVFLADEAVCIGGPLPQESYLNIPAIISAAEITGADAIHPGYGFLSENPGFAEICTACGMKFIGPSPETMILMGDKAKAREIAIKAGVPVVPGSGIVKDVKEALKICEEIGYPVLVKAAHGGGGRGMRLINSKEEAETLITTAMAEAEAAFGSGEVYIEKYIENPRHIEIQLIADQFSNVVTYGERECSLQRRHQKILEEAPSPFVDEDLRERLSEAAKKIARLINYEGAGTIEFLVDKDKNFYFIEMNTRIQVEHPVTELVTQQDLIAKQISVAAGEKLKEDGIKLQGHAIEFRITCEDYKKGFRPAPGKIEKLVLPGGFGVRVDTHIYEGYSVPQYYDSLLAKLIVWGETREEAIRRGKRALSEFIIEGTLKTTLPLHIRLLEDENFIKGLLDTKVLENKILPNIKD